MCFHKESKSILLIPNNYQMRRFEA